MNEITTIGAIMLWAEKTLPEGWANCDGATLDAMSNRDLYSLLGNRLGGDQNRTFMLPKLPNVGAARHIICTRGEFPSR